MTTYLKQLIRNIIWKLDYTGERVVLSEMNADTKTLIQHLARYVFALKYASKKNILDCACGSGYGCALLSTIAANVTGLDIDKKSIQYAKKNNTFYCPISFYTANIEKTELKDSYDLIISFETIEHLIKPQNFIKLVSNSLNRNGVFLFSVPINDPPNKYHRHRFSWKKIKKLTDLSLDGQIKWFSQIDQNIYQGIMNNAQFAIGIWKNEYD